MSTIYKYKTPDSAKDDLLVSKEYVDLRLKRLEDAINNTTSRSIPPVLDNVSINDLDLSSTTVKASAVVQDPGNRMVSDTQLASFKSRPTSGEVDLKLKTVEADVKKYVDEIYNRLLNMPNAVERLKKISQLISSDDTLNQFFQALDNTISEADFDRHIKSSAHINNNERKALNILLDLINDGTVDRLTKAKSKIETLTNDVNAVSSQANNKFEDKIYTPENYPADFNMTKNEGVISFKSGKYIFDTPMIANTALPLIINGSGMNTTKFIIDTDNILNNCTIRDLSFEQSMDLKELAEIKICGDTVLDGVALTGCKIVITGDNVIIERCRFDNCAFSFSQYSNNILITHNRFTRTKMPMFMSQSVIINDNFRY